MDQKLKKALITKDACTVEKYASKNDNDFGGNAFISLELHKNKWSLMEVIEIGKPDLTESFLRDHDLIDINANDYNDEPPGYTALHHAVSEFDADHVKLFLDYGADPNILDNYSRTPLHLLYCDAEPEHDHGTGLEILEMLIDHGAKAFTVNNNRKNLQVKYILENGKEDVIETVMNMNIDMKAQYENGDTVAHCLARNGYPGIFAVMRDRDFDVNARNDAQETPLFEAAGLASIHTVEFLLSKGADVNAADANNRTPIYRTTRSYNLPIYWDADADQLECAMILLECGADVQEPATKNGLPHTVFDIILENHKNDIMCKIILEHLALQEAVGTIITALIRSKIDFKNQFKEYFDLCKQHLTYVVHQSVTLLKLLTYTEEKLIPYMRNKELARILFSHGVKLESMNFLYYHRLLQKRLTKAKKIANLRNAASAVLGKLIGVVHSCHPVVLEIIMRYLNCQDLNSLLNV